MNEKLKLPLSETSINTTQEGQISKPESEKIKTQGQLFDEADRITAEVQEKLKLDLITVKREGILRYQAVETLFSIWAAREGAILGDALTRKCTLSLRT